MRYAQLTALHLLELYRAHRVNLRTLYTFVYFIGAGHLSS